MAKNPPLTSIEDPRVLDATGAETIPNPDVPTFLTPPQKLYMVLAGIFISSLLLGDMVGGKFFQYGNVRLSVGIIPFPVTFVLTDVINEFYGARGARFITYVAMAMAVYAFLVLQLAIGLPVAAGSPVSQDQFNAVFGFGARLFVASLIAFLVSQLADISIFHVFKRLTHSRMIWLRSTGSTAVSQLADTVTINFILLAGRMPAPEIVKIVVDSYVYKFIVAVALTPAIYALHAVVVRIFRLHPEAAVEPGEAI